MSVIVTTGTTPIPIISTSQQPVHVTTSPQSIGVTVPIGKPGKPGPPGQDAKWDSMTQAEFDALPTKDPATLYVIIG